MDLPFLTDEQRDAINAWIESRPQADSGAIGGRFTWMLTPTSIGLVVKVKDCHNNEEEDFSDYENW